MAQANWRQAKDVGNRLLGYHTLGIECKGVLSTGGDRILVGNQVGVGPTRNTISSFAPIEISHHGSEENYPRGSESPWRILPNRLDTSHKPSKFTVSGIRITTLLSRSCDLINI